MSPCHRERGAERVSPTVEALFDRGEIERWLRRDPVRQVYAIGDLDDFFWPQTRWWGHRAASGELDAVALLYEGLRTPTFLALTDDLPPMHTLVSALLPTLPGHVYLHLEPGLAEVLERRYALKPHGLHLRLGLPGAVRADGLDTSAAEELGPENLDEVRAFYREAFPANWFDPRMLETRRYYGLRHDGGLVSVAGVHVWSPQLEVAALGNIATHPDRRGRGLGRQVTARACQALADDRCAVALNVAADNAAALRVYERLGFVHHSALEEFEAHAR